MVASTVSTPIRTEMTMYNNHIAATGDNTNVDNGDVPGKSPVDSEEPLNQPQIGSKPKPNINESYATPQGLQRLKIGELDFLFIRLSGDIDVKTLNCTLNLTKLINQDIDKWQNKCISVNTLNTEDGDKYSGTQVGGHNL